MLKNEMYLSQVLKKYWGYDNFRPLQRESCKAILEGKDCCIVMATGTGKSLIYQLPSIALNDMGVRACSIVISPLISLMEDQVESLLSKGVPAAMLGGSSSKDTESRARRGEFQVLYSSPEKIIDWKEGFSECQRNCRITCVAIDESHCVSEWGHDFRPAYRALSVLRSWCPLKSPFTDQTFNESVWHGAVPVIALTATATTQVMRDIIHNLALRDPLIIQTTFNRPNLHYSVRLRSSPSDLIRLLFETKNRYLPEELPTNTRPFPATLIYVGSKAEAEEIAREIRNSSLLKGITAAHYHAGMSLRERSEVQRNFAYDKTRIIVATVAFGMGIHKPDIQLVVNYGLPTSIEAYYQQTGRAGRDDSPSDCFLLYSPNDVTRAANLVSRHGPQHPGTEERSNRKIREMNAYANATTGCRRELLLRYFEDRLGLDELKGSPPPRRRCCDLCDEALVPLKSSTTGASVEGSPWMNRAGASVTTSSSAVVVDLTNEVYLLLKAVRDTRESYGLSMPVSLLMGSHEKAMQRLPGYSSSECFGKGRRHPKEWWIALARQLAEPSGMNLLVATIARTWGGMLGGGRGSGGFAYQKYSLSDRARAILLAPFQQPIQLVPSKELRQFSRDPEKSSSSPSPSRSSTVANSLSLNGRTGLTTCSTAKGVGRRFQLSNAHLLELETMLRQVRAQIAERSGTNPYSVLSSNDMKALLSELPTSLGSLSLVAGWGEWKLQSFGKDFVDGIREYLLKHDLFRSEHAEDGPVSRNDDGVVSTSENSNWLETPLKNQSEDVPPPPKRLRLYQPAYTCIPTEDSKENKNTFVEEVILNNNVQPSVESSVDNSSLCRLPRCSSSGSDNDSVSGLDMVDGILGSSVYTQESPLEDATEIGLIADSDMTALNSPDTFSVGINSRQPSYLPPESTVKKAVRTAPRSLGVSLGTKSKITGVKLKRHTGECLVKSSTNTIKSLSENYDVESEIINCLRSHPDGLLFTQILASVGLHTKHSDNIDGESVEINSRTISSLADLSPVVKDAINSLSSSCCIYRNADKYILV